jgi:hypothetical protein
MDVATLKTMARGIAVARASAEEEQPRRPSNPAWFDRWCSWCGREFNQLVSGLTCYCSGECKKVANRVNSQKKVRLVTIAAPRLKREYPKKVEAPPRERIKCRGCNETFVVRTGKIWCSQACKTRFLRREGI